MGIFETLTQRETEVLFFICKGYLNKEISSELGITIDTIKKHNKNIFKKMNVRNRTEAIIVANSFHKKFKNQSIL